MKHEDEHWSSEDEPIVHRLRDEKPRASGFELDRMKMAVMAKVKPSRSLGGRPRSRIAAALLTVGLMVGGTAGTIAATRGSTSGSGAAQSEYKPCDHGGPKDRERCRQEHCALNTTHGREICLCHHGSTADRTRCRREIDCAELRARGEVCHFESAGTGVVATEKHRAPRIAVKAQRR